MDVLGIRADVGTLVDDGPLILHAIATFGIVMPEIVRVRADVPTILLNVSAVSANVGLVGPDGPLGIGYLLPIAAYIGVQRMLILSNRALTGGMSR